VQVEKSVGMEPAEYKVKILKKTKNLKSQLEILKLKPMQSEMIFSKSQSATKLTI